MAKLSSLLGILLFLPTVHAADKLETVLASLDKAAGSFQTMTGRIEKITFTKILNDKTVETGLITVKKSGPKSMKLLIRISKPDQKSYAFEGKKGLVYYPKTNTVEEYDLGKQKEVLDQFLLLGFSTPSSELLKNYSIKLGGEDTVAGQRAARLELMPKAANVQNYMSKAEIWVGVNDGRTIQQKFNEKSGDFRQVTYTDAKWNGALADSELKLDAPKNAKHIQPMK